MRDLVCAGSAAPEPAIRGIATSGGQPRVLAFVRAWSADREPRGALSSIRAELRGLGAELVILSAREAWSFCPEDDLEYRGGGADVERAIAGAAEHYGVPPGGDALFVIDGRGIVRFAHRSAEPIDRSLLAALTMAGDAQLDPPAQAAGPVLWARREWNLTCLVTAFSVALLGGCKRKEAGKPAGPPPSGEVAVTLQVNGTARALDKLLEPV